jgi:hypothetical protein
MDRVVGDVRVQLLPRPCGLRGELVVLVGADPEQAVEVFAHGREMPLEFAVELLDQLGPEHLQLGLELGLEQLEVMARGRGHVGLGHRRSSRCDATSAFVAPARATRMPRSIARSRAIPRRSASGYRPPATRAVGSIVASCAA